MPVTPLSVLHRRWLRLAVAVAVSGAALAVASPTQAQYFTPIADCTISVDPAKVNGTDEMTMTLTSTTDGGYAKMTVVNDQGNLVWGSPAMPLSPFNVTQSADTWMSTYAGMPGTFTWRVWSWDGDSSTEPLCSTVVTLNVRDAPTFTTTSPLAAGQVGQPYTTQILGDPGDYPEATCAITGAVPPGLSFTPPAAGTTDTLDCGTLTGTPTVAGTYTVTGVITYQVPEPGPVPTAETGPTVPETVTQDYTITIAAAPVVDTPRYTG